jgi:hypothetical protein
MTRRRAALGLLLATAFWAFGCTVHHEIVAKGKSEATVTISHGLSFTLKGGTEGIHVPDNPVTGPIDVGPGAEITINIPAGTEIKLDDKVDIGGENSTMASTASAFLATAAPISSAPAPRPVPLPTTTSLSGTVMPGSTYTWYLPELLGDANGAVVPVTGWVTAKAYQDALVNDGSGNYTLRPGGLKSFAYVVTGPPAVWQAPFDTPWGPVTGNGTFETTDGMVFQFSGSPSQVSGSGTTGYTDPDGNTFEYGYVGSFPVLLTSGTGDATGSTGVDGGVDVY